MAGHRSGIQMHQAKVRQTHARIRGVRRGDAKVVRRRIAHLLGRLNGTVSGAAFSRKDFIRLTQPLAKRVARLGGSIITSSKALASGLKAVIIRRAD